MGSFHCRMVFCCSERSFWTRLSAQRNRERFSLLDGWDDQRLPTLSCTVHFGMVAIAVCSHYGLRGWCAFLNLLCEFSRVLCVYVWRGNLSGPFCVVLQLSCTWSPCMSQGFCSSLRVDVVASWLFLGSASIPLFSLMCLPYMFWSFRPIGCAQNNHTHHTTHHTPHTTHHTPHTTHHTTHTTHHTPHTTHHNPQPTTHNPQPTTHNPQPTTHNPQPTTTTTTITQPQPQPQQQQTQQQTQQRTQQRTQRHRLRQVCVAVFSFV